MSIFHKFKHAVKHAAHEVKHTADQAVDQTKHAADQAGDQISHGADQAVDAVKKGADEAREAINNMSEITDQIKNEILGALKSAENAAVSAIKSAEKSATDEVSKVANEAKAEFDKDLKELEDKFKSKAEKEVLEDLVDVIKALSPDDVSVQLGPVSLDVGDVENKVEHFINWAKNPPNNRETYIQFVKDLAPNSLTLIEGIGLGLVVQSDDAKIDITETWNAESILDNIDNILERAGL